MRQQFLGTATTNFPAAIFCMNFRCFRLNIILFHVSCFVSYSRIILEFAIIGEIIPYFSLKLKFLKVLR